MIIQLPELCFLANSYVIFVFSQAMAKGKHFFKTFFFSSQEEKEVEETLFPILDHTYICKTSVLLFILKSFCTSAKGQKTELVTLCLSWVLSLERKV